MALDRGTVYGTGYAGSHWTGLTASIDGIVQGGILPTPPELFSGKPTPSLPGVGKSMVAHEQPEAGIPGPAPAPAFPWIWLLAIGAVAFLLLAVLS